MLFELKSEVLKDLEEWFNDQTDADLIVWLTYNFSVDKKLAETVLARLPEARRVVICNLRRPAAGPTVVATSESLVNLKENAGWEVRCIHRTHAKGVFAWNGDQFLGAVMGSFNLTKTALTGGDNGQVESIVRIGPGELSEASLKWLRDAIFESSLEVQRQWCNSPDRTTVLDPRQREPPPQWDLKELHDKCVKKLKDWPGEPVVSTHPDVDKFQWEVLNTLWEESQKASIDLGYDRWLLHLPVGLGKTFIALTYALKAIVERGRHPRVLYITPNQWVSRSVNKAVEELGIPKELVVISHPEGLQRSGQHLRMFGVVILDEIQNWAARHFIRSKKTHPGGYSHWVEEVLDLQTNESTADVVQTVLALSATPYRFACLEPGPATWNDSRSGGEWASYETKPFISRYLCFARQQATATKARNVVEDHVATLSMPVNGWTLEKAKLRKLVACFEFEDLDKQMHNNLKRTMKERGDELEFGKWAANLRDAWRKAIGGKDGISDIAHKIAEKLTPTGKGIVFLPIACKEERKLLWEALEKLEVLGGLKLYDVTSDQGKPTEDITESLDGFQEALAPALLLAVNRLTEGISLPDVNTLFMLRPTRSPLIVMQQLGRGIRRQPGREKTLMVYDLAQAKEAYDKLKLADDHGSTSRVPSSRGMRTAGSPSPPVPAGSPSGHGITLRFTFNKSTYSVVLSDGRKQVRFQRHDGSWSHRNYTHRFNDGRWELSPHNERTAFPITIEHREGSWKARVNVDESFAASEGRWRECKVHS